MSRARYYFRLPNGNDWSQRVWVRWVFGVLGSLLTGATAYLILDGRFGEGDIGRATIPTLFWGPILLAHATGVTERYFSRFVDLSLGVVRWRLSPADGSLRPRYHRVSLARVRDIRVSVLRIDFLMDDGAVHAMPLGELPYGVVQEVKRRFEGHTSLAGATARALGVEAQAAAG